MEKRCNQNRCTINYYGLWPYTEARREEVTSCQGEDLGYNWQQGDDDDYLNVTAGAAGILSGKFIHIQQNN